MMLFIGKIVATVFLAVLIWDVATIYARRRDINAGQWGALMVAALFMVGFIGFIVWV